MNKSDQHIELEGQKFYMLLPMTLRVPRAFVRFWPRRWTWARFLILTENTQREYQKR